jgi:DUF971 family protein
MFPKKIRIEDSKYLIIEWDDSSTSKIKLIVLRKVCPCAFCSVARKEQSDSFIPLFSKNQVTVADIKIAGKYALAVKWEDGHNTGYYEFDVLKKLAE